VGRGRKTGGDFGGGKTNCGVAAGWPGQLSMWRSTCWGDLKVRKQIGQCTSTATTTAGDIDVLTVVDVTCSIVLCIVLSCIALVLSRSSGFRVISSNRGLRQSAPPYLIPQRNELLNKFLHNFIWP
jgi:hypothetical protein